MEEAGTRLAQAEWDWSSEPFNVREYLLHLQIDVESPEPAQTYTQSLSAELSSFAAVKKAVHQYFQDRYEKSRDYEKTTWIELQHNAIAGKKPAIEWFKREIEEFLRRNNWLGIDYPDIYSSIVEATYQETYGLGVISTWWKHPQYDISQAARIIGTKVFYEIPGQVQEIQPISYQSVDDVLRVAKQLSLRNPTSQLNPHNPSLQIDMEDGTRVTIIIPPWAVQPTIVFRHFTINKISLRGIAEKGTFPMEALPILEWLARGRATTMLCGPVKSGKSTLLSAFLAERKSYDKMLIVQKDFDELRASTHYPKHQIMEFILTKHNMHDIFDLVLRSDYEYIVIGELRSLEAEIFMKACERGLPGALSTYHTPDPENIPSQLADLIIDENSGKSYNSQYERAARNIHFAIIMEERKDRTKRLSRITVFDWNVQTRAFATHDIMRWSYQNERWEYSSFIPHRVMEILAKFAPDETRMGSAALRGLAAAYPIDDQSAV